MGLINRVDLAVRMWQIQFFSRMAAILKLANIVLFDKYLKTLDYEHDCLFQHNAHEHTEIVNVTNGNETGAYL